MIEEKNYLGLANLLDETWKCKKELSPNITNAEIDTLFDVLLDCGANGAKLLGAGGGGFILFEGDLEVMKNVTSSLPNNKIMPFFYS